MKSKKFFSVLLACALFVGIMQFKVIAASNSDATFNDDDFSRIYYSRLDSVVNNAQDFLDSIDCKNALENSVPMYNLNEEIEAIYFPLQPTGYLIASYKDGHVIEFSPKSQPFSLEKNSGKLYYNGILEYYEEVNDTQIIQLPSKNLQEKEAVSISYNKALIENLPTYEYQLSTYALEPNNPTPKQWVITSKTYMCVISAITNLLQYYQDNMNANVYPGTVDPNRDEAAYALRRFLNQGGPDAGYIYGGETRLNIICRRHNYDGRIYSGLQDYFNRSDVDSYTVNAYGVGRITIDAIKTQLNSYGRPVVLGINTSALGSTSDGRHDVLAYTYMETANTTYFIVNDGWGGNWTHICVDDISSLSALYLS